VRRPTRLFPLLLLSLAACGNPAARRGATVLFASGADLQSINPLLTLHPLAHQVQRYVLLTTLARYDSSLTPQPYLARSWSWSDDRRRLRFVLHSGVPWHDGVPTTSRDAKWTLDAARDPATGYPRLTDVAGLDSVAAPNDTTLILYWESPQQRFPDVLTDLAILPAHLLDSVPHGRLRQAAWNEHPVGNGPFRFVRHDPNRRWVFDADTAFPAALGGPPHIDRLVIAVVDEPTTNLAALTAGELDFAGISPAHASFVRRDSSLAVVDYPLLFTYGIVFNTRRPPFNDIRLRRAVLLALDRKEIVQGYAYGFATVASGPVPPSLPAYLPLPVTPYRPDSARALLAGRRVGFELLTVGSGEGALEQMIQAKLAPVGFDVRIRQLELSTFLDRTYGPRHEFDAAVLGIQGDLGLGYLARIAELAGMKAPAEPAAAQRFFADSLPVAFIYHSRGLQGMNRRVHGVHMDIRGELATITGWWVDSLP
jgi:peptide/nickel transport system substrate-binding protein